jgi:hypothetical protein
MQTFRLIVFLVSAVVLPLLAARLVASRVPLPVKLVLGAGIALAFRYLLGCVWLPESVAALRCKAVLSTLSLGVFWVALTKRLKSENVRAWVSFVVGMLYPLAVCFVLFPSTAASGGLVAADATPLTAVLVPGIVGFGSILGNATFWIAWTVIVWIGTFGKRATVAARVLLAVAAVAIVSWFASPRVRDRVSEVKGDLVAALRESVTDRWPSLTRRTEKIVAVWQDAVARDRALVAEGRTGTAKLRAATRIGASVRELRKELLPVDSRNLLAGVSSMDRRIASLRKDLAGLRERRLLRPEKADTLDARIAKAEADLAVLESGRAEAVEKLRSDLASIGLELPKVFLTVDLGEIVDNAIVAKNIGLVVENLRALMEKEKGDPAAAKRYFGAYVVMLDVQSECYRQYLAKAGTGLWRDGVLRVAAEAEAAKRANEGKAAADGCSEENRKAFLHAAGTNERTLKAANAYLAILESHEGIIRERLAAVDGRHEVALSFWESADIAGAFGERIASDRADFDALLELSLPEIAFFDDEAMQAEFDAITQKLAGE